MLVLILPTSEGWKAEWTLAGKKVAKYSTLSRIGYGTRDLRVGRQRSYHCANPPAPLHVTFKVNEELFHDCFIVSFGTLTAAWRCWQGFDCTASGLKWKKNLCLWILCWNFNHGNILSRNIWLTLVGSWEFSVQPWYFNMTVDIRGADNSYM